MRIKMKSTAAGPEGVFMEGVVYPVPDELGKEWIDGGYAELVDEPTKEILPEAGDKRKKVKANAAKVDNAADSGTGDPTGSEVPPQD